MKRVVLETLLTARAAKRPVALLTDLKSGLQALVDAGGEQDWPPDDALRAAVLDAMVRDRSARFEGPAGPVLIQVFNPPLRMIIVGAVHIAQSLAPMAGLAGYDVTVVDPRRAFAADSRFPHVAVLTQWPHEALEKLMPDPRTAVITLTHDPKLDDAALGAALRSPAFYIGSLGSGKTHRARLKRLARQGFSEQELARIHGPVGLPLGGREPADIAVAILAQVTQERHRASTA